MLRPRELTEATGRLPDDVEGALWEGVARGLLTSDGFAAIRALSRGDRRQTSLRPRLPQPPAARARPPRAGRRALGTRPRRGRGGGRRRRRPRALDREELAEALADQLLARWGVVFYDLVAHEAPAMRWRELQWALRRLEDRGQVRGGRFVGGFSGEQFALAEAVDGLKTVRRTEASGRTVSVRSDRPAQRHGGDPPRRARAGPPHRDRRAAAVDELNRWMARARRWAA
ncbi:MAG: hypothetical protein U5R31_08990 [Acidimicrobiia bacterium]|nr:hypothetical protein [Acidimicrobiia bacterium]